MVFEGVRRLPGDLSMSSGVEVGRKLGGGREDSRRTSGRTSVSGREVVISRHTVVRPGLGHPMGSPAEREIIVLGLHVW